MPNQPMQPSGEVGCFQMANLSSPPGDWCRCDGQVEVIGADLLF